MNPLYLLDPYKKEFSSKVKTVNGKNILLDQTAFYPNSGGQPNDTGTITTKEGTIYTVINVSKIEGNISHEVDKEGLQIGDEVNCSIDWERRYTLMRYHTAAHILSTLIHTQTGADITGNQLGLDKARVDFSLENFDRTLMQSFEDKVNHIIQSATAVQFSILPREEAFKIPSLVKLRKAFDESIQEIRIVEIVGIDIQACGGCHVKNTSEIKGIKITSLENKGKERRRIYFSLVE